VIRPGPGLAALLLLCACAQTPEVSPPEELAAPQPVTRISETPPLAFEGAKREIRRQRPLARIDRTAPVEDVWERIRLGFGMADLHDPLVAEKMASYVARPDYLQRMFDRSRLYLFHVVEELEKRGMPTELALLPMVESAYNPMAYSRAHASGLWQFIPGTGKRFELEQNWWYDARRDIVESMATGTWRSPPTTGARTRWDARSRRTRLPACRATTRASPCRPRRGTTCRSCRR
jgi:hypothetical protein